MYLPTYVNVAVVAANTDFIIPIEKKILFVRNFCTLQFGNGFFQTISSIVKTQCQ